METVFDRPHALSDVTLSYCPGCTHGIVTRLVAEVVDELGIEGKTIGVAPVGCSVTAYNFFEFDMQQAAHGRAPAVATGIKRVNPDNVCVYISGRRRPCGYWYSRDSSCCCKRRKYNDYFYK